MSMDLPQFHFAKQVALGEIEMKDVPMELQGVVRKIVRRSEATDFCLFSLDPNKLTEEMKKKFKPKGRGAERRMPKTTSRQLD